MALVLPLVAGLTQMVATADTGSLNAAAYERLSKLVGQWRGSFEWSGARQDSGPMDARYYLTGAGSALVEDLEVDSKVVMTSVYHLDGADLRMTHYCAARNQPRLKATYVDDDTVRFSFVDATNLPGPDAPHVTGLEIQLRGERDLTLIFTFLAKGKESHERIQLSRAVPADPPGKGRGSAMWSGPEPRGPIAPFVLDMVGTPRRSDGGLDPATRFHDTLERISWQGHEAMRRIAATTRPGETEFTRWSTVVFDETTLLPYYTELRTAEGAFVRREYDGVHVEEERTAGDFRTPPPPGSRRETVSLKFDLSEPAFAWAEGVGLPVLLAVPLGEGFEGSVPVVSGSSSAVTPCLVGPCHVDRISYRVIGKEEITGLSERPVLTWKVSVPETRFVFWIACDKPRLEGVTWPRSAGVMTAGQADAVYSMGPMTVK